MKWERIPSPGKMTGGNLWRAKITRWEFAIAKSHGRYYLTAAFGFSAKPESLGVFDSLDDAKAVAVRLSNT